MLGGLCNPEIKGRKSFICLSVQLQNQYLYLSRKKEIYLWCVFANPIIVKFSVPVVLVLLFVAVVLGLWGAMKFFSLGIKYCCLVLQHLPLWNYFLLQGVLSLLCDAYWLLNEITLEAAVCFVCTNHITFISDSSCWSWLLLRYFILVCVLREDCPLLLSFGLFFHYWMLLVW